MGLNDTAWESLFQKYRILDRVREKGCFVISAAQIKEFREPRLMTKFDHRASLPAVFAGNGLAVLPVTRGDYMIAPFSAYQDFEEADVPIQKVSIPSHMQSLLPQFLTSEAIALNCANACGIFGEFLEDDALLPTVSGRMGSGEFDFTIDTASGKRRVAVSGSQIEIDAAYEGIRSLALFEAKRETLAEDFLIRQIYYPFRVWSARVTKPVRTVFLVFSGGVFHLYEYRFEDPAYYNSLRLVKRKSYMIAAEIRLEDIENLLRTVPPVQEPPIPFPQANRMSRVVNLLELLGERSMTRQNITAEYAFDERQTDYYTNAGRYLDCIDKVRGDGGIRFQLSPVGRRILNMGYKERRLALTAQILRHRVFSETLRLVLRCGAMPDRREIVRIMKQSDLYRVGSDDTYARRSSTVAGWIGWILGNLNESS